MPKNQIARLASMSAGVLAIVLALGMPGDVPTDQTPPLATASAEPSHDINSYALFGAEELSVKGRCRYPDTGVIEGGNIGVAAPRDSNQSKPPRLRTGNPIFMSPGSQVVGDYVNLEKGSNVGDLYANSLQNSFANELAAGQTHIQNGPIPFSLPVLNNSDPEMALPTFPAFSAGSQNITLEKNTTLSLAPGSYGNLWVKDKATINLTHGIYVFKEFKLSKDSVANVEDDTEVRITGGLLFNVGSQVVGSGLTKFFVRGDGYSTTEKAIAFGWFPQFSGQIYQSINPNGGVINLGDTGVFYGRFWATHIDSDCDFKVYYRAPEGVRGRVYDDLSCNGADNGEPPLQNVQLYLDCNANGVLDGNEQSGFTNSSGVFQFKNNRTGSCKLRPVVPTGKKCISPSPGCSFNVTLGAMGVVHDNSYTFGFTSQNNSNCGQTPSPDKFSGKVVTTPFCNNSVPTFNPVSGALMYLDCNGNKALDSGEASATSDASGQWTISNGKIGLSCAVRTTGVAGYKCSTPGGDCSYAVVPGSTGQTFSGYNFVFVPETDTTCNQPPGGEDGGGDSGGCKISNRTQNSQGIDAHGFRLFSLSKEALRATERAARAKGKKMKPQTRNKILELADRNYKTLWGLAYNTFPIVAWECTGTAAISCEQRFTSDRQKQIVSMADELIKQLKKTLGKAGLKTPKGKQIVSNALKERAAILEITQGFPESFFVCNK